MKIYKIKTNSTNNSEVELSLVTEGSNVDGVDYKNFNFNDRFVKNDTVLMESLLRQIINTNE